MRTNGSRACNDDFHVYLIFNEVKRGVNSLRSWKLKRTILVAAPKSFVQHVVLNFPFNFRFNFHFYFFIILDFILSASSPTR